MTSKEFNEVVEFRISQIREILQKKALEYSDGDRDRLHNFNRASKVNDESRERSLWGMATKHLVSVLDIIDKMDDPLYVPPRETVLEKVGDLISYLILLEASIEERRKELNLKK